MEKVNNNKGNFQVGEDFLKCIGEASDTVSDKGKNSDQSPLCRGEDLTIGQQSRRLTHWGLVGSKVVGFEMINRLRAPYKVFDLIKSTFSVYMSSYCNIQRHQVGVTANQDSSELRPARPLTTEKGALVYINMDGG